MGLPLWMGQVPDYQIVENHMHITVGEFVIACPVNVFLIGCAKGKAAVVKWEKERTTGEVVAFPNMDATGTH